MMVRRVLLVLGVTLLGVLGGTAFAAPQALWAVTTQVVPQALWAVTTQVAQQSVETIGAWSGAVRTALPSTELVVERLVGDGSPRRLAMLAAGTLLLVSGLGLLVLDLRRRRATRRGGRPAARSVRPVTPRHTPKVGVRWPRAVPSPVAMAPTRRAGRALTPVQVRAMVDEGTSPAEIAQATGLPLDAVALLLAVAPAAVPEAARAA